MGADVAFKFRHNLDMSSIEAMMDDLSSKIGHTVIDDRDLQMREKMRGHNHIIINFYGDIPSEYTAFYMGDMSKDMNVVKLEWIYKNHLTADPGFWMRFWQLYELLTEEGRAEYVYNFNEFAEFRKRLLQQMLPLMKEPLVYYLPDCNRELSELMKLDIDEVAWCKERGYAIFSVSDFMLGRHQTLDPNIETLFVDDFADIIGGAGITREHYGPASDAGDRQRGLYE